MAMKKAEWIQLGIVAAVALAFAVLLLTLLPQTIGIWAGAILIAGLTATAWHFRNCAAFHVTSQDGQNQDTEEWTADEWKKWARQQADLLEAEAEEVTARERRLAEKMVKYHEVLEFPVASELNSLDADTNSLSEADARVNEILEKEAASVYEKIRTNAYLVNGKIDVSVIRGDALDLIQRIAREYQPHSKQPLLETSFNQLARAFSRVCLHSLVLLEQLPLDVRNYTLNELFAYFQKAVKAYGTYQQVAPWMQRLGRTAYAGRLAAGANPVTLGAWWLASEVAQRGAKHVVTNVVDRRAIAVLHDLVSVFGVEVANIYGPGYRQRDAAWIYGSELTELLSKVPVSRESLRQGLKEITQLPLKCEYDRIYLYRCLATSTAAGFRLSDPSSISREQRETIAVNLERFVREVVHGVGGDELDDWIQDTESRLDLKLKVKSSDSVANDNSPEQVATCLRSIHGFCLSMLACEPEILVREFESMKLPGLLSLEERQRYLEQFEEQRVIEFAVADLDPESTLLPTYLEDLMATAVQTQRCERHHYDLLLETAMHFRRSRQEATGIMAAACRRILQRAMPSADLQKSLNDEQAIALALVCPPESQIVDLFHSVEPDDAATGHRPAAIAVMESPASGRLVILITAPFENHGRWNQVESWSAVPIEGYVYDDCRLTLTDASGEPPAADPSSAESEASAWSRQTSVLLNGTVLNRKFERRFASLLPRET